MFYKKILIIAFSLGLGLCQSFFKSSFPNEIGFRTARSSAIGQTHFINSNTSVNALRNPAKLHYSDDKIKIDFNFFGLLDSERRSIELQDYFGDFLTESDYAFNQNLFNYLHLGISGKINSVGFAISHGPWSTFDYEYTEEVRGSASFDDGIIGIRDPIVGYHILEHHGQINSTSFGFGVSITKNLSLGLGLNHLSNGHLDYNLRVVQVGSSVENLAPITNSSGESTLNEDSFLSFSAILKKPNIEYFFGYEQDAELNKSSNLSISDNSGLPVYVIPGTVENDNFSSIDPGDASQFFEIENSYELRYLPNLYIPKPKKIKFGINHREGTKSNSRLFSLEIIDNRFESSYYKDFYKINLGIEYMKFENTIRMGISYKEPIVQALNPETLFSFGSSKKFGDLIFDFGVSYSYQKYKYHDLFPVQGDVRPDFDTIHDSQWSLVSTISYSL